MDINLCVWVQRAKTRWARTRDAGHFILEFGTCPCLFGWLLRPYIMFGTIFAIVGSGPYGVPWLSHFIIIPTFSQSYTCWLALHDHFSYVCHILHTIGKSLNHFLMMTQALQLNKTSMSYETRMRERERAYVGVNDERFALDHSCKLICNLKYVYVSAIKYTCLSFFFFILISISNVNKICNIFL